MIVVSLALFGSATFFLYAGWYLGVFAGESWLPWAFWTGVIGTLVCANLCVWRWIIKRSRAETDIGSYEHGPHFFMFKDKDKDKDADTSGATFMMIGHRSDNLWASPEERVDTFVVRLEPEAGS